MMQLIIVTIVLLFSALGLAAQTTGQRTVTKAEIDKQERKYQRKRKAILAKRQAAAALAKT